MMLMDPLERTLWDMIPSDLNPLGHTNPPGRNSAKDQGCVKLPSSNDRQVGMDN
jgi:hypothetical protein